MIRGMDNQKHGTVQRSLLVNLASNSFQTQIQINLLSVAVDHEHLPGGLGVIETIRVLVLSKGPDTFWGMRVISPAEAKPLLAG